jgi:hypothetical protein
MPELLTKEGQKILKEAVSPEHKKAEDNVFELFKAKKKMRYENEEWR